jgi:DNA-binding transcriptional LysR family regulator
MDRLHSMRVFARVVDEGSFVKAARKLNLSGAVVSRLVADLEEHLGARLMNRTTRRLALTETGEAYLERIRHVLAEVDEAEALATASTAEPRGHLRILCTPSFALHQLARHLKTFRERYPRVSIELSTAGPVETVDERFDVTIIGEGKRKIDGDFIARRLASSEIVTCASPQYLHAHGRPGHPRELGGHELMFPTSVREVTFQMIGSRADAAEALSIERPAASLSADHAGMLHAAVLAGFGITALPSFVVADALMEGTLERVLPQWRLGTLMLYAGMPTRKHVPARTRAFIDFLVETFGGLASDPWLLAAGCPTQAPISLASGGGRVEQTAVLDKAA